MCGNTSDIYGDHAISACAFQGDQTRHHNSLRDALISQAQSAMLAPTKEERHLLDDSSHPGDITIRHWHRCKGCLTAFDVTVTSPLRKDLLKKSIDEPCCPLIKASELKRQKCCDACIKAGLAFVPLAVATFGAWDSSTIDHIWDFACFAANRAGCDPSLAIKHSFERLSVVLQRSNAGLLINRRSLPNAQSHIDRVR